MSRPGASNGQAILALVLAIPIALLLVTTFSPFQGGPEVAPEPEPMPSRSKAKTPPKAKKGDVPKAGPKAVEPPAPPAPPAPPNDEPEVEVAPPPREVPERAQIP